MSKHENFITDKKHIKYQLEKLNHGIEEHLKEALFDVLYNKHGIHSFTGLPVDKTVLFYHLCQFKKAQQDRLKTEISKDEWDILCPPTGVTDLREWTPKLIITVIINVLSIPPPIGGWNQTVHSNIVEDDSIGATILSAIRFLEYIMMSVNSTKDVFDLENWTTLKNILAKLTYSNMKKFEELFDHCVHKYKVTMQQHSQQTQHQQQHQQQPQKPLQHQSQYQSEKQQEQQSLQPEIQYLQKQQPDSAQPLAHSKKKEPVESCEIGDISEPVYNPKQPERVSLATENEEYYKEQKSKKKGKDDKVSGENYDKDKFLNTEQKFESNEQLTAKPAATSDAELQSTVKELAQSFADSTRQLTKTMKQLEIETTASHNENEGEG